MDIPAKGRSFCKIVLSEISFHNKLMIPRKFVRKYGKYLRVRVYLKVPRGRVWPVDLVGNNGEVWLQNGWPEFARFYSLCFGHFLIFKYKGNSYFDVFIYNKSGIEIEYPLAIRTKVEKRMMSNTDEARACKKTRANSACIEACHISKPLKPELNHHNPLHQAIALAKVYKSENPSFILIVGPSYLGGKSRVDIKKAFALRYMKSTRNFKVCFQVEKRTWPVTCTVSPQRYRFCKGWLKFARDNSLSIGDVCVFELTDQDQMLLKVFIQRAAKC